MGDETHQYNPRVTCMCEHYATTQNSSTTVPLVSKGNDKEKAFYEHQGVLCMCGRKPSTTCFKAYFAAESKYKARFARETAVAPHRSAVPMYLPPLVLLRDMVVSVSDSPAGETKIGIDSRCPKMSICRSTSTTFRIILGTRKILLNACRFSDKAAERINTDVGCTAANMSRLIQVFQGEFRRSNKAAEMTTLAACLTQSAFGGNVVRFIY